MLLHGDAAFPGQGVVAETLNLQALSGYSTGGTIHIIMNNQLGFTTDPNDARSTRYASDLAKGYDVPVIHVNADDVEACIHAVRLAMGFRREFRRDAVIDLIGYRRFGHNETDEPAYTQPLMYDKIKKHPPVRKIYAQKLIGEGLVTEEEAEELAAEAYQALADAHAELREAMTQDPGTGEFEIDTGPSKEPRTAVPAETLRSLNEQLLRVPSGFSVHRKLKPQLERRRETIGDEGGIDWAQAEALAFASLLVQGTPIRLTGQDTERGTFSQRHLVAARHEDRREVHADPEPEVGDRAVRAAQQPAVGDRVPRLRVRLLGPGARGARPVGGAVRRLRERGAGRHRPVPRLRARQVGPDDHGSRCSCRTATRGRARSTRAAASSASCSSRPRATSASPTSRRPAQYFHLLRRQALVQKARPLVVMTPKSLLRLPAAASHDRRARGRRAPGRDRRSRPARRRARTSRSSSSAPARSTTTSSPTRRVRRRSTSRSRASSCSTRSPRTSCAR